MITDSMELFASKNVRGIRKFHGVLGSIVFDRDVRFSSKFWTGIEEEMTTMMCFGKASHPETGATNAPLSASHSTPHTCTGERWAI